MNIFQLQCLDEEGAWDIEDPPIERINRNMVFGSLRDSIFSTIMGEISAEEFNQKFRKIAQCSKNKVRPGKKYSRDKVGKPKRHHVYHRMTQSRKQFGYKSRNLRNLNSRCFCN